MTFYIEKPDQLFSVVVFGTTGGKFASEMCGQGGKYHGLHWTSPAMDSEEAAAEYAKKLAASMG